MSAAEAAAAWSVDLNDHRSQLITRELLEAVDLVVVMDVIQARAARRLHPTTRCEVVLLGDLDNEAPESRTITDPWGKPLTAFNQVYERIERCCQHLARVVRP
jgi:protein-tyrosine-phosphatase